MSMSYVLVMDGSTHFNPEMAYDLRQRYAKIVGDHMEDVAIHRKNRDYSEYFRALEDLHTLTQHKYKSKKKKEGKEPKSYTELRQAVIVVSNENPYAWSGKGNNAKEIADIEKALRDLEEYIYLKMNEANMFGSKREMEGLI